MHFSKLPNVGDVVWTVFPTKEISPKPRPAIVVATDEKSHSIQVIYGTSQKIDRIYSGEFLISKEHQDFHQTGLIYSTKFDTNNKVALPYNYTWFKTAPSRNGDPTRATPVLGLLSANLIVELVKTANKNKNKK